MNLRRREYCLHIQARKLVLFEEALLLFETQGPNIERYMKVAAVVQNGDQGYRVIHDEKKRTTIQISLDPFFKRVDRIESRKELEPELSKTDVSEIAACPPSPIADNPSAPSSFTSFPSSSQ